MIIQSIVPNLMVEDVNATVDFYTKLLGFTFVQSVPENGAFHWALVQTGDVQVMFQKEKSIKEEYPQLEAHSSGGALTLYIRTKNVSELYSEIQNQVNLIKPLGKTFYGADEFAIQDPNGFILTFSEFTD